MNQKSAEKPVIMVVDDNPTNLSVLFEYLNHLDYRVLVAQSGESALQQLKFGLPDLILLDVMMPGLDGFETCEILKQNEKTRDIPVIFITALSDTQEKIKGFKIGAVDYIIKPFQKDEVLVRINTHITISRQKKKLGELNAAKDKFFSIIAHDLKNVFNGLIGGSRLIADSCSCMEQENLESLANSMYISAKNAYSLLENLLNWARLQKDAIEFNPASMNLAEMADAVIDVFHLRARQKEISMTSCVPKGIRVFADARMIDTVLRNLVSNAVKYTPKGGNIRISAQQENRIVEIRVEDTGVGISPKNLGKLLKIDSQFKKEGTEGEVGTGLGLILCKEFVEKNGGEIRVESREGKGSVFAFTLKIPVGEEEMS